MTARVQFQFRDEVAARLAANAEAAGKSRQAYLQDLIMGEDDGGATVSVRSGGPSGPPRRTAARAERAAAAVEARAAATKMQRTAPPRDQAFRQPFSKEEQVKS